LLEAIIKYARSLGGEPPADQVAVLREYVESLQAVRGSIASNIEPLIAALERDEVDKEVAREIYALAGYYVEAASKTEDEAARLVRPYLGDPGFDDDLRRSFRKLYVLAEEAYKR